MNRVLFSSATDRWATPAHVYAALHKEFRFNLDPCPIAPKFDGLSAECKWSGKRVYCNPPYGPAIADWLRRGPEARLAVYLLPDRTDTKWFHELVLPHATEIRFVKGRLKFGNAKHNAPFPSMIVVFGNKK
jgi:hypothetical protein